MDPPSESFRHQLADAGLLIETGVDGLYGHSSAYEDVVRSIEGLVTRSGSGDDEKRQAVHFPPVIPRWVFERTDYLRSFPNLTGSVHSFSGDDRLHADLLARLDNEEDWTSVLEPSEVVLRPAACHPLYPTCAGSLPRGGRHFEISGWCFRHEPSADPTRMQAFRMHEFVYVGAPDTAVSHRDRWAERGLEVIEQLGLEAEVVVASDPFFGRAGRMLSASQRDQHLKLELVTPIMSADRPTAVASANCHEDHFGAAFGILTADDAPAHSSCMGFGLDRLALALLRANGLDPSRWPATLRRLLWP